MATLFLWWGLTLIIAFPIVLPQVGFAKLLGAILMLIGAVLLLLSRG